VREADSCFVWIFVLEGCTVPIPFIFWLLMILWLLFGLYWNRSDIRGGNYGVMGGNLLLFVLLLLLGIGIFGSPIKG
jgi:hypothetical protein